MRLILSIAATVFITTPVFAETPEVCQTYFERESFSDNDLYHGKSEIVALLSELETALIPAFMSSEDTDLALNLFDLVYMEGAIDALNARIVYEETLADFADGEITYESGMRMVRTVYDSVIINFGTEVVDRVLTHIGEDHELFTPISEVTECYFATRELMAADYRALYQQLALHFHNKEMGESE